MALCATGPGLRLPPLPLSLKEPRAQGLKDTLAKCPGPTEEGERGQGGRERKWKEERFGWREGGKNREREIDKQAREREKERE